MSDPLRCGLCGRDIPAERIAAAISRGTTAKWCGDRCSSDAAKLREADRIRERLSCANNIEAGDAPCKNPNCTNCYPSMKGKS